MSAPRRVALALAASLAACASPPSRTEATPTARVPATAREMLVAHLTMGVIERVARMSDDEVVVELLRPPGADAAKRERPAKAAPPPGRLPPALPVPLRADRLSRT